MGVRREMGGRTTGSILEGLLRRLDGPCATALRLKCFRAEVRNTVKRSRSANRHVTTSPATRTSWRSTAVACAKSLATPMMMAQAGPYTHPLSSEVIDDDDDH